MIYSFKYAHIYVLSNSIDLEIECRVRGVCKGTNIERLENLIAQVKEEETSSVLIPTKAHVSATKNPKRELKICSDKLKDFHHQSQILRKKKILKI